MTIEQQIKDRVLADLQAAMPALDFEMADALPNRLDEITIPKGFITFSTKQVNDALRTNLHEGYDLPFSISVLDEEADLDGFSQSVQVAIGSDNTLNGKALDTNLSTNDVLNIEAEDGDDFKLLSLVYITRFRHLYGRPDLL